MIGLCRDSIGITCGLSGVHFTSGEGHVSFSDCSFSPAEASPIGRLLVLPSTQTPSGYPALEDTPPRTPVLKPKFLHNPCKSYMNPKPG